MALRNLIGDAPTVVGLDLSLNRSGVADGATACTFRPRCDGMERLRKVRDFMRLATDGADLVVIEGYSMGSHGAHSHALGELGGVVRLALFEAGIPHVDVPPATLKVYATGKGNAGKGDVLAEAVRRLGYDGGDDNEADALWLRAFGLELMGAPVVTLPEAHRRALAKVDLPAGAAMRKAGA